MLGLRRGRGSRRRGPRCQGSSRRPRVLAVDDVLLFDEREAILAFDLLAHAGEDKLAGPALLGNEIGDPARALRLLPNPDALQRSEEHTSELQSLMRISYTVFCLKQQNEYVNLLQ